MAAHNVDQAGPEARARHHLRAAECGQHCFEEHVPPILGVERRPCTHGLAYEPLRHRREAHVPHHGKQLGLGPLGGLPPPHAPQEDGLLAPGHQPVLLHQRQHLCARRQLRRQLLEAVQRHLHRGLLERRQGEGVGEPPHVERVGRREPRPDRVSARVLERVDHQARGCLEHLGQQALVDLTLALVDKGQQRLEHRRADALEREVPRARGKRHPVGLELDALGADGEVGEPVVAPEGDERGVVWDAAAQCELGRSNGGGLRGGGRGAGGRVRARFFGACLRVWRQFAAGCPSSGHIPRPVTGGATHASDLRIRTRVPRSRSVARGGPPHTARPSQRGPQHYLAVAAGGEEPRPRGVEGDGHDADVLGGLVAAQDLDRHDERVGHEVVVDAAVVDVHRGVVGGGGEERQGGVVGDAAHGELVRAQGLVRRGGEVHVEPAELLVVGAEDQVVAARVVHAHVPLRGHEEERLARVEGDALDAPLALGEGRARRALGRLVQQHGARCPLGRHARQVVALVVPADEARALGVAHLPRHARRLQRRRGPRPRHAASRGHLRLEEPLAPLRTLAALVALRQQDDHLVAHGGGGHVELLARVERYASHLRAQPPHARAPAGGHLPKAHRAVDAAREQPLSRGADRERVDAAGVPPVLLRVELGEGAQLGGLGQLRDQRLGVDVEARALLARAEVEVEAALESLLDQRRVERHPPQRGEALRHKVERPVGGVHLLPGLLLLGRQQVLGRRVVRLGVARQRHLGRRQDGPLLDPLHGLVPYEVLVVGLALLLLLLAVDHALLVLLGAHGHHEAHDLLRLPLGGQEGGLGGRRVAQRVDAVRVVEGDRLGEGVDLGVGVAAALQPADEREVFVAQHDVDAVHRVEDRAAGVGVVEARDEGVELILLRAAHDLAPGEAWGEGYGPG
eukprot:scaffold2018_cov56-Phaeocystis_antarctica.AAC.2